MNQPFMHTTSNLFAGVSKQPLHSALQSIRKSMIAGEHIKQ